MAVHPCHFRGCQPLFRQRPSSFYASPSRLSGQLSLEAMLVLLIFIVIVGIAYFAVSNIGTGAEKSINLSLARSSFNELSSKINEACSLGNGNVRIVEMKGDSMKLSSQGRKLSAVSGKFIANADFNCELSVLQGGPARSFTIKNTEGGIEIS